MLEILYDTATKEVRAWNADMSVKGNLTPKEGQGVVIFPIDPPTFDSDWYKVDLENQAIVGNPDYTPPTPLRFELHHSGLPDRLERIESFLRQAYP